MAPIRSSTGTVLSVTRATTEEETILFDAFGQRFELIVEKNHKLDRLRTGDHYDLLKGRVANAPGSWVRLMRRGDELSGMIRDAADVYVIEARAETVASLLDPAASKGSTNVIYRLADMVLGSGGLACAADMPGSDKADGITGGGTSRIGIQRSMNSGQTAFDELVSEFGGPETANARSATRRITIGAIADHHLYSFLSLRGIDTRSSLLGRFNVVDGIYTDELGLEIVLDDVKVFTTPSSDPFSPAETDARTLLDEVTRYRRGTLGHPNQLHLGMTHLVTGRELNPDEDTAGIAFIGLAGRFGACTPTGTSLTENDLSQTYSALLIAHEIGHNLGAPHDGDKNFACASTPPTFIMAPTINARYDTFSQCSIDTMQPILNGASCISTIPVIDIVMSRPAEVSGGEPLAMALGGRLDLTYKITNTGTGMAPSVLSQLALAGSFRADTLTVAGGSCSPAMGVCSLANLAAGDGKTIKTTLTALAAGTFTINHGVTATADIDTSNNSRSMRVSVTANPDLRVSVSGANGLFVGDSTNATILVENNSSITATDIAIELSATSGLSIDKVNSTGASCGATSCVAGSLNGRDNLLVDARVTLNATTNQVFTAAVTANQDDVVPADNATSLWIGPPSPDNGGSALEWYLVLALIVLAARPRPH